MASKLELENRITELEKLLSETDNKIILAKLKDANDQLLSLEKEFDNARDANEKLNVQLIEAEDKLQAALVENANFRNILKEADSALAKIHSEKIAYENTVNEQATLIASLNKKIDESASASKLGNSYCVLNGKPCKILAVDELQWISMLSSKREFDQDMTALVVDSRGIPSLK